MPTSPVPNTLRAVASGTCLGEIWSNAFALWVETGFTLSDANATTIADIIRDFYMAAPTTGSGLGAMRPTASALTKVAIYDLRSVPNPVPKERTYNIAGTDTAVAPMELAGVISWRTATGGRRGRGRTYVGPLGTGAISNGTSTVPPQLSSNFVTQAVQAAGSLRTKLTAASTALAIYSPTFLTSSLVTGGYVDRNIDVQRRRGDSISLAAGVSF